MVNPQFRTTARALRPVPRLPRETYRPAHPILCLRTKLGSALPSAMPTHPALCLRIKLGGRLARGHSIVHKTKPIKFLMRRHRPTSRRSSSTPPSAFLAGRARKQKLPDVNVWYQSRCPPHIWSILIVVGR